MEPVLFEEKDSVGWLILNSPETRNALSLEVMMNMMEKFDIIKQNRNIKVLVIKGNGPCFCAGHNLKEIIGEDSDVHVLRKIFSTCTEMMKKIHRLPQPVIARIHGIATAAGCQLAAACDLAIAETGAKFAVPGVKIGLFCSTPMVPLSRLIGRRRSLDMLLSGRYVSAHEAEKFGLVNRVVEPDKLDEETEKWAAELAENSLFTLEFGKQAFYNQIDLDESSAYDYAKEAIVMNSFAQDAGEGISAFLEKRKPQWKDR